MRKSHNKHIMQFVIATIVIAMLSACAGNQVQPDYDTDTDFSQYSSYRWKTEKPDKKTHAKNPFVHSAILQEIDLVLKARNLTKAESGGEVDFIVDYQMSIETRQSRSNSSISFGTGSHSGGSSVGIGIALPLGGSGSENEVTFIISITDKKKNKIVWRAVGMETTSTNPAGSKFKNFLRELAKKIISEYPPKK